MVDAEENVISASGSSTADAENKAQDPLLAATAAVAAADGHDEQSKSVTDALSSMAVTTDDGAASNDDSIPPPPPEQQQQPPAIAQQLPINLPANLDELDDEAAAALDNEFLSLLPPCILPRIDKLKSLNVKRDEILDEYRVERAMLEKKFSAIMQPLYEERKAVVIGEFDGAIGEEAKKLKVDVAEEGVVEDVNDEEDSAGGGGGQQDVRGIPQFWACAMGHVDVIAELITEG
mmetsp:Transcript_574/g.1037  ORF Transcript_574/g.1037 Transcript_574/m.1037 type:complete len:234 (-) Transcript_574:1081-1782(-)